MAANVSNKHEMAYCVQQAESMIKVRMRSNGNLRKEVVILAN